MVLYVAVELGSDFPIYVGTRNEVAHWAKLTPENISAYATANRESLKNGCRFEKVVVEWDRVTDGYR